MKLIEIFNSLFEGVVKTEKIDLMGRECTFQLVKREKSTREKYILNLIYNPAGDSIFDTFQNIKDYEKIKSNLIDQFKNSDQSQYSKRKTV